MKVFRFLISTALAVGLCWALNTRLEIGKTALPPLGKFLDPANGFWQNAEQAAPEVATLVQLPDLKGKVEVIYDQELFPHVFAETDEDLYFMQGYVTAMHRLWQMEFQTHAAAGRVSEIVGPVAIELDRTNRRKGLPLAAQNAVAEMLKDPVANMVVQQYTKGVNAWINSLEYKDLPLEYKLLDYRPEPWEPIKCAYLLKYMANDLSFGNNDFENLAMLQAVGKEYFELLFPSAQVDRAEPVVSKPGQWNFTPKTVVPPTDSLFKNYTANTYTEEREPNIGSNNWAVSGSKTANGNPILCGDPHLSLGLPSIWYVMQLHGPTVNVMGATLPGAPNIIIGFNDSIAWSVTNAERDLVDWYSIQFKDETRQEYLLDSQWVKADIRIEEIKQRGAETLYDTVIYTQWGPVMFDRSFKPESGRKDYALRWIAHDPSLEVQTFYNLNRGKNHADYLEALKTYDCPAQNFAFASANGDVAMTVQGKFPVKWRGQGKFPLDGTTTATRWQDYIPDEHNVMELNPIRGFISSANQIFADSTYPYWGMGDGYEHYRNRRINQMLDSLKNITVDDMKRLQNDNFNWFAFENLRMFLTQIETKQLSDEEKKIVNLMKAWDYFNDPNKEAPSYWEEWWRVLYPKLWDEFTTGNVRYAMPDKFVTTQLLRERPDLKFVDITGTPEKETVADLLLISFREMLANMATKRGELNSLEWADYKGTSAMHLARLAPLSVMNIRNGGNRSVVNATSERHGPSWRIVVEMTKEGPLGWGVYPGGQSGNPGSRFYANFIENWAKGDYFKLHFMKAPDAQAPFVLLRQEFAAQ